MYKKIKKITFCLLFFIIAIIFYSSCFAKYVIEDTHTVAKLNIDRCAPSIDLVDISTSNTSYPNYINKTHSVRAKIKITEKNLVSNQFSSNSIKILVNNQEITPRIYGFSLVSKTSTELVYSFSLINLIGDGNLQIVIPSGIVTDKSGLSNNTCSFSTNIIVDNTAPTFTFKETLLENKKSKAEIVCNEGLRQVSGWTLANNSTTLEKDFPNYIKYTVPVMDYAGNSSEALVDVKQATNMLLEYGTYDEHSSFTMVTGGSISSPDTIASNSICKTEAIFCRFSGDINNLSLMSNAYIHTHWEAGYPITCNLTNLSYYQGYNSWYTIGTHRLIKHFGNMFTLIGGVGSNIPGKTAGPTPNPIPEDIAKQYLYGISGLAFRLSNTNDYSVVYQTYVNNVGWLSATSNGKENVYQHDKPISAFRLNIVPKSETQRFIDYLNRDVGTKNIHN